jgi:hypothetical protein
MTERELCAEGFDFDLWANQKWFECLDRKGWPEPDKEIFAHLLSAQQIWLTRCQGTSLTAMPNIDLQMDELQRLNREWIRVLNEIEVSTLIQYKRTTGEPLCARLFDIAHHVVDHGTYHRDEIRGLFLARGDEEFPETGFIGYALERG